MRARNIKPSFFTNPDLGECSPVSRLLFVGLWCCADREGRLLDRPKQVKAQVFPYDNVNIDEHLGELTRWGLIERYDVGGVKIIAIPKFLKHQRPHVKEKSSELPGKQAEPQPRHEQAPTQVGASNDLGMNEPALNPECGILNPECGILNEECRDSIPGASTSKKAVASRPSNVDQQAWDDWLHVRKKKHRVGPPTATAMQRIASEAAKAGISLNEAIVIAAGKEWRGFEAAWMESSVRAGPTTFTQQRLANTQQAGEEFLQAIGGDGDGSIGQDRV